MCESGEVLKRETAGERENNRREKLNKNRNTTLNRRIQYSPMAASQLSNAATNDIITWENIRIPLLKQDTSLCAA